MDALSDLLQGMRLTGVVFLESRFTAPWSVVSRLRPEDYKSFLADPAEVIAYHYVRRGRLVLQVAGEDPVEVHAGEAVLLPRSDPHTLGSAAGLAAVEASVLVQPGEGGRLSRIVHGGGGEETHLICGFLGSAQRGNALIASLPRVLKINMAEAGLDEWIETSVRFAQRGLNEGLIGAATVMSRLSELMFVEAVRRYAAALPPEQRGWLFALRDPYVSKALALLHGRPCHPWTAESLAGAVSLSRSAFADRFAAAVGMPPKRYLISWRLQMAKDKLRAGLKPVAQIAHEVGYEAEAAFNRAFKREFGVPPAAWRKQA